MSDLAELLALVAGIAFTVFVIAWFTVLPMLGLLYIFGWLA